MDVNGALHLGSLFVHLHRIWSYFLPVHSGSLPVLSHSSACLSVSGLWNPSWGRPELPFVLGEPSIKFCNSSRVPHIHVPEHPESKTAFIFPNLNNLQHFSIPKDKWRLSYREKSIVKITIVYACTYARKYWAAQILKNIETFLRFISLLKHFFLAIFIYLHCISSEFPVFLKSLNFRLRRSSCVTEGGRPERIV